MSDHERLTILEMEYALVSARLNAIDAQLTLIGKRLEQQEGRFDTIDRKLDVIIRHLGLEP